MWNNPSKLKILEFEIITISINCFIKAKLDASRKEVFEPREAFRQIFLEAERKRLEELAAQEASIASIKADPKDKKKGSAGKGGKKK